MITTVEVILNGRSFRIAGNPDDPYFAGVADLPPSFEGLRSVVLNHLPEDAVALDVGANIGLTSLLLGDLLPRGRVLCFEPSPVNFAHLERNLQDNGAANVVPHRLAISSAPGTLLFHDSAFGAGSHVVTDAHMTAAGTIGVAVQARSLDAVVAEAGLDRLDLVKVDVEGFELDVLDGMAETLRRFRPLVFMEFNAWTTIAFRNLNPRVLLDRFLELLPHAYALDGTALRPLAGPGDRLGFLHDNLVRHGCVDDLVGSPDPARFGPSGRPAPTPPQESVSPPPAAEPLPAVAAESRRAGRLWRALRGG